MDTTAELAARTEANHAHLVAILLSKESYRTQFLCFFKRCVTMFVKGKILTYHLVDQALHLAQFLIGHFLEVGEVET